MRLAVVVVFASLTAAAWGVTWALLLTPMFGWWAAPPAIAVALTMGYATLWEHR